MLTQLQIKGLAIIDKLEIEFADGFNIITGETGAGKSILIKALGLLLGAKADAAVVRKGTEAAMVCGSFHVPANHPLIRFLDKVGIPVEQAPPQEQAVIIRRRLNAKGRSQAWINDAPVTLNVLRSASALLIDIFAQHENHRLLDPKHHTRIVDQFLENRGLARDVRDAFLRCQTLATEISTLRQQILAARSNADYLHFRHEELAKFNPNPDDYRSVSEIARSGRDLLEKRTAFAKAQQLVDSGEGGEAIATILWKAQRFLSSSDDGQKLAESAAEAASAIEDLSFAIGQALERVEINPQDIEKAQSRLGQYQTLFRKLNVTDIDALVERFEELTKELSLLSACEDRLKEKLTDLGSALDHLDQLAEQLSCQRERASGMIKENVEKELRGLAMPDAELHVHLQSIARPVQPPDFRDFSQELQGCSQELWGRLASHSENGQESAQFLLRANAGEDLRPLHKVASGGEVSRLMLAIKGALMAGAESCVLVFDEIDSGISGRVAAIVGKKLRRLSEKFQVICISHLPQVAAHAERHFRVHKSPAKGRTEATISALNKKESEEEIARLLSGAELSAKSLANARALIEGAASPTL